MYSRANRFPVRQFLQCVLVGGGLVAAAGSAMAFEIVPHRVAYSFEVIGRDSQAGVSDVAGGMSFEWADACDGWAIDQRYLLRITNENGDDLVSQVSSVSWESKDGRRFRFNSKSELNGELIEEYSGDARLDKAGGEGTATFTIPGDETVPLQPGTRFPTDLTLVLMAAAARGERNYSGLVFEGGEVEGSVPVTATILPQRPARHKGLLKPPLGPHPIWPVYTAYFKPGKRDGTPDTEFAMDLQENGIVPDFTLNYGGLKLRAHLERIEKLPAVKC